MLFHALPGERISVRMMIEQLLRLALYRTTRRPVGSA